jgi:phenylpropionate dioxygenase-like ring-hydroxylating dioxygenase large terminal subunit
MATNLLHYFTFGAPSTPDTCTPEKEKEKPVRALPASWYTSPAMFSLERRAIFSRRWLFLTHSSRLKSPGDWLRYAIAGFEIILLKDRAGTINAFHNVCRHRAHPVIDKEGGSGNSRILACRYHGWSYGLDGKLAKAPGYQGLEFDKEVNGLFGIHVRVDRNGFVWVNMDAGEVPEVTFEEYFENVDVQQRYVESGIEFGDYELDHVYEIEGKMPFSCLVLRLQAWLALSNVPALTSTPGHFNWKILADNFNECYHCPTTHPDVPSFLNLETFDSTLKDGHIQHHCKPTDEQVKAGVVTHSTYYFPNASMSVS